MRKNSARLRNAFSAYYATPVGKANSALILVTLTATIAIRWLGPRAGNASSALSDVLAVSLSLLAMGSGALALKIGEEIWQQRHMDRFRAFFGDHAVENRYHIYFSSFTSIGGLKSDHEEATERNARPKGVANVIPYEEVAGIAELEAVFRRYGGALEICLDRHARRGAHDFPHVGCLAVGLGFNTVTTSLSRYSGHLFEISYGTFSWDDADRSSVPSGNETTDELTINGERVQPDRLKDYALIARIVHNGQPYIVCAGRSAKGTAAALKYLTTRWLDLLGAYKKKDPMRFHMVAKLSHERDHLEPGEITPPVFKRVERSV